MLQGAENPRIHQPDPRLPWLPTATPSHSHTYMNTYPMEYYSSIKIEILPFVTPWMDLEGIKVSEISQTEEDK